MAVGGNPNDRLGPASMTAVAPLADGFVAVGDGPGGAIDWTSPDGRSWTRTEFPSKVLRNAHIQALAVGTNQIVAAGSIASLNGRIRPGLWATAAGPDWSLVGGSWSLVADPSAGSTGTADATDVGLMAGVVATASGFVAIGDIDQAGHAWRSPDGLTWSETHDLPSAGPLDLLQLVDGPGGLVATGDDFGAGGWHAVTWVSTDDGRTWTESAFPTGIIDAITANGGAYWAYGYDPGPNGQGGLAPRQVFKSTDGSHWASIGTVPPGPVQAAVAIRTSTQDLLAVALMNDAPGGTSSGIYTSADGRTWSRDDAGVSARTPVTYDAMAATAGSILAVGGIAARPGAWIALPVTDPAPAGPPPPSGKPVACPGAGAGVAAILILNPRDRLRCFGSRTLTFTAFSVQSEGLGGTCDCTASPAWLTGGGLGYPALWLSPFETPFGRAATLSGFVRPTVKGAKPTSQWVTVTGHFDDPASSACRVRNLDASLREPAATTILRCRESFAVTRIGSAPAPDPTTDLRIASPWAVEPSDGGIDGVPSEARAVGMAEVWRDDGPVASMVVFRTALSATATKAFTDRIAHENGGVQGRSELGVAVAISPTNGTTIFTIGHLTFVVSGANSSPPSAATLLTITTALIRANR
ncbi:MAG TPA: sialidase family protein [Candidatus Acidoferrum sp.]|nr:sialidase family protein [Candidatus Acidoferrum sp.]